MVISFSLPIHCFIHLRCRVYCTPGMKGCGAANASPRHLLGNQSTAACISCSDIKGILSLLLSLYPSHLLLSLHTFSSFLSRDPSFSLTPLLSLSHNLFLFISHTHILSHSLSLTQSHLLLLSIISPSFSHSLSFSLSHTYSLSHTLFLSLSLSFFLSLTHIFSLSLLLSLYPPLFLTHIFSLSLSLPPPPPPPPPLRNHAITCCMNILLMHLRN